MQKSGVYGTLKEQDTQWTHTGKENGKMKKLIALLLALMLALALAVPASAAGEDIGIIGGADGPTAIFVTGLYDAQALWGLAVKVFSNVLVIVLNYLFSKWIIFKKK